MNTALKIIKENSKMKQYEQCSIIIQVLDDKDVLVASPNDASMYEDDFFLN